MQASYGALPRSAGMEGSPRFFRRAALLVAAVCSVGVLALAAVTPGARPTALIGWWSPAPFASSWMQPPYSQDIGAPLVQLAEQNVPGQVLAAGLPAQGDGRSAYIDGLGSTAAQLKEQERALEAQKQKIEQKQQDVQHLYEAALKAQDENAERRGEEEQAAARRDAQVHGLPWTQEMGTDISFIPTAQFPASMKGAWHHNTPYEGAQGEKALPPASQGAAGSSPEISAALQIAVKEKVDLDAAKEEIKKLKSKLLGGGGGGVLHTRQTVTPAFPETWKAPEEMLGKGVIKRARTQKKHLVPDAFSVAQDKLNEKRKQWAEKNAGNGDEVPSYIQEAAERRAYETAHGKTEAKGKTHQLQFAHKQGKQGQQLRMLPWRRAVRVLPVPNVNFATALKRFIAAGEEHGLVKAAQVPSLVVASGRRKRLLDAAKEGVDGVVARALGNIKSKVVKGHQKSLFDYNLDGEEEPGEEVWPYKNEAAKGSPCSVPGACTHHLREEPYFTLQDPETFAKRLQDRFKEDEEEEEPEEVVNLGDSQVGGSFDDYVPPKDAYVHNLLTSSAPGIDHFGHLAPLSRANEQLMYGPTYHKIINMIYGHKFSKEEEDKKAAEDDADGKFYHDLAPEVKLGDDQIGGDDEEMPVALTMPQMPSPDPDHFDHWAYNDPKNLELLNGAYWKSMQRDGWNDRMTPATEAYEQQKAGSHDRTLSDTWGQVAHYYGFETAGGYKEAREKAQGGNWRDKVFTGTDEIVEDHVGTRGSDSPFFKGKDNPVLSHTDAKRATDEAAAVRAHTAAMIKEGVKEASSTTAARL